MRDDNFEPFQGGLILDAVRQNALFPTTFDVPDPDDIAALKAGDFVKACFHHKESEMAGERMWVEVEANDVKNQKIAGTIGNDPVAVPHLKFGDTVVLEYRHCLATLPKEG